MKVEGRTGGIGEVEHERKKLVELQNAREDGPLVVVNRL